MRKRIAGILLCCAMLLGLLPTAALAAGTDTGGSIRLGTSGIFGYSSADGYDYIYYGTWNNKPIKWRVLDDETNMPDETRHETIIISWEKGLFLLSDAAMATGDIGADFTPFDNTRDPKSNVWQGSDAQAWCRDFAGEAGAQNKVPDAFTAGELAAILATYKSDRACVVFDPGISHDYGRVYDSAANILNGDKVFFLSAEERFGGSTAGIPRNGS